MDPAFRRRYAARTGLALLAVLACMITAPTGIATAAEPAAASFGAGSGLMPLLTAAGDPAATRLSAAQQLSPAFGLPNPKKKKRKRKVVTGCVCGFGLYAPWTPPGRALTIGECANFYNSADRPESSHRKRRGKWNDDRWAIDIGACEADALGTPIVAAHSGYVVLEHSGDSYGYTIVIEQSEGGLATRYAHLVPPNTKAKPGSKREPQYVEEEDFVLAGQRIGTLGRSGLAAGAPPHLHFALYKGDGDYEGARPTPLAGVDICKTCEGIQVTSQTQIQNGIVAELRAKLAGRSPKGVGPLGTIELAPGQAVPFDFDIEFNKDFKKSYVLKPRNTNTIASLTGSGGPLVGTKAGNPKRASFGGVLRAGAIAPSDEPYRLEWDAVNAKGRYLNLQVTLLVRIPPPPPVIVDPPEPPPPDTTPPSVPSGLQATAGDGQISLDWAPNLEPDLHHYNVYVRNADGSWPAAPVRKAGEDSTVMTALVNGTAYTYAVSASDNAGNESARSSPVTAAPVAAGPQPGTEWVVDYEGPGTFKTSATWHSGGGAGAHGGYYQWFENYVPCKNDPAYANRVNGTWSQYLPPGTYDVYAFIPSSINGSTVAYAFGVHYELADSTGATPVVADQIYHGGTWTHLGLRAFRGASSVKIDNLDTQEPGTCFRKYIAADAVKWVYRGPP